MFNIESYVTPILLSYVDKYVRDFKPADAQVSLWGGGVTLHNLVLKADVLQKEVSLPFTLVSGRIHELLIQVPWTKIMSEPIVVTINTIECILSLNPPPDESPIPEAPRTQVVEAPPGYMQALVRRIVSNIAVRVHSLIVKYVHDDIVLSLNVKRLSVDSVGIDWEPTFADIDQNYPAIRRLVRLDDLTLCLDKSDSDGKIRFYQEPLLYRCQLDFRVLTKLVSANTRRASSLSVQLRSSKLAWGVTSEQLTLLLRLIKERSLIEVTSAKSPPPAPNITQATPLHASSSNTAEPMRTESWSEWAWSWLPTWMDREGVEETPAPPTPVPIDFSSYFEQVSFIFKVMELEASSRKRARGVLEFVATDAVVKSSICSPTMLRVKIGARFLTLSSHGKCVCGHLDLNGLNDERTLYLNKIEQEVEEPWSWVEEDFNDQTIETAVVAEEGLKETPDTAPLETSSNMSIQQNQEAVQDLPKDNIDEFWQKMAPVVYLEYSHDRSPSDAFVNPYDNPPRDFQYSDWVEECVIKILIRPMLLQISTGLFHRLAALTAALNEISNLEHGGPTMRILTVEECDALSENLPQRRIDIDVTGFCARVLPWDHSLVKRPLKPPLVLDLEMPKATILLTGPLYPHRVCSAACQMPEDSGPLWQGAQFHVSAAISDLQAGISSPAEGTKRPIARADLRFVTHNLLFKDYFTRQESVLFSYTIKIREANMCGSSARLQAALQVPISNLDETVSPLLRYTTLPKDALADEDAVAVDFTLEDLSMRGYITKHVNTHIVTMQSARATAFHASVGEDKQAWLFSGPESPTTSPYLRLACQWCSEPISNSLEYLGVWMEPTALSVDPLFVSWLGYRPRVKLNTDSLLQISGVRNMSTSYILRRRSTPPSSSGRGQSRSGSGAELVHMRPRSLGSSSERSERKDLKQTAPIVNTQSWWSGDNLLRLHERLNRLLLTAEIGLFLVYVTPSTASAVDCYTVREAMMRHATAMKDVLVFSLGRFSMLSNVQTKHLWQEVRHDGPTFLRDQTGTVPESFPWKMKLTDVSCYALEFHSASEMPAGLERPASGLRSQLKISQMVMPKTILEMVTTTVTLSVVTKSLQIKTFTKRPEAHKQTGTIREDERVKFFTTGAEFKPSSLKEFLRGPSKRRNDKSPEPEPPKPPPESEATIKSGPVVSLGVNLHADTPPIVFRLEQGQIHVVAMAIHCFAHIIQLLLRKPLSIHYSTHSSQGVNKPTAMSSVSELERQSLSEESENQSEQLISIFESKSSVIETPKLKSFFWFQWVISRATVVVATSEVKLAFDIEDVISTVDLQEHYNQFKIKIASASIRHYKRFGSDDWTAGVLGGRVLEAREPTNDKEEDNFLTVTITQAQISNLPASWKEELHPKTLQQNSKMSSMWEIYATLAPLEAVLQPVILEHLTAWLHELVPRSFCSLKNKEEDSSGSWQWPCCYITAGGLRLLLTKDEIKKSNTDDTLMFIIGKIMVSPHPENPICRRMVNLGADSSWTTIGAEGTQYEVIVKSLSVKSARLCQLVNQEDFESPHTKGTGGENPALKWSQQVASPIITPILHSVDIGCVLAPASYSCDAIICGPAIELNLLSDCSIELSIDKLNFAYNLAKHITYATRRRAGSSILLDADFICPYATLLTSPESSDSSSLDNEYALPEESAKMTVETNRIYAFDSGVDTATSQSTFKLKGTDSSTPLKKCVSIVVADQTAKSSDYLEVFVTMGMIDLSLYVSDDGSPEIVALRPPPVVRKTVVETEPVLKIIVNEIKEEAKQVVHSSDTTNKSLTDTIRKADVGNIKLEVPETLPLATKCAGNLSLLHVTLKQPNLYFWKRKKQRNLQVSLFDAWIGLGSRQGEDNWNESLMTTAGGSPDPVTDIPPALATLKIELSPDAYATGAANSRGSVQLDIERPILFEVSTGRLQRLKAITDLVERQFSESDTIRSPTIERRNPFLYNARNYMVKNTIESITVQTNQIGVRGNEGVFGWDSIKIQTAVGTRPDKIIGRLLLTSLLVSTGPPTDRRNVVLQPMMAGVSFEATWDAWRRSEGELLAREPIIRIGIDLDRVTFDLRPSDLAVVERIKNSLKFVLKTDKKVSESESTTSVESTSPSIDLKLTLSSSNKSKACNDSNESTDHFYKDDLRSGAFKIVTGSQLPMAYQVTLHGSTVSWRYPHPRAITHLVAFPIPGHDEEVECALELYCPMLSRWEPHTYFKLPVSEPRELQLSVTHSDMIFAMMWRVRACSDNNQILPPFEFDEKKFLPRQDPLSAEPPPESDYYKNVCNVSAEQLSGVLRVDSYFAPKLMARMRFALHLASLEIHAHNAMPDVSKQAKTLEGYYVSRPLMRSHRVLTLRLKDTATHFLSGPSSRIVVDTNFSSDIVDCATGAMQELVDEFRVQSTLTNSGDKKLRLRAGDLRLGLHVPRVKTLMSLLTDWKSAYEQHFKVTQQRIDEKISIISPTKETVEDTARALEGRVSLWIHNNCAAALRIGQEGTDEIVPLGSGASLAYRWHSPSAKRKLRFSIVSPSTDWRWSNSISFKEGSNRVKLEDPSKSNNNYSSGRGVFLFVNVVEHGARRDMYLAGRIILANMLRLNLLFKVRARNHDSNTWQTISSGELQAESLGQSVLCDSECDVILKVKFATHEMGWSGDIPLKECRKENVPWLVKVPSMGEISYTSVWCRVIRARNDGRVIATTWPFYVLRSHLPLDADVMVATDKGAGQSEKQPDQSQMPPIIQTALGRGSTTHLITPGTTAAHHILTFQYRNIECPVTREAVPLHYGVTDTSVFDKPVPITSVDEVVQAIQKWLDRSGQHVQSDWPYSIVKNHWHGTWQPALLQPRCDVSVRYQPICVGGGCSLELQLCPVVLLVNASPIALTLRAHDAAPLCKLEPGNAISPPSAVIKKPFFMSVEMGRETFVSGQLQVCTQDPGRYGAPPPGHVAVDRASNFAIQCNHKVALLTMYYEIKEEINVLGISSTFVLVNKLGTDLMVSAIAVPNEMEKISTLQPKTFKVVPPTKADGSYGTPLCRFWVRGRWRGGDADELRTFLCIALPSGSYPAFAPVPIRLGKPPLRRAIALRNMNNQSVPIVITQLHHEGRWVITVGKDPCPQFLIHNRTRTALAVAQPDTIKDEAIVSKVPVVGECSGARWLCTVDADSMVHYSTPAYCLRYPPPLHPTRPPKPLLTFSSGKDEVKPEWCLPIAIADGEQLLQLSGGVTIKVRVRTYPHSTLIELQGVDQHDISASDIRRRLIGPFSDEHLPDKQNTYSENILQPSNEEDNLFETSFVQDWAGTSKLEELQILPSDSRVESTSKLVEGNKGSEEILPKKTEDIFLATVDDDEMKESSLAKLSANVQEDIADWSNTSNMWTESEQARCVVGSIAVTLAASADTVPLLALHLQRVAMVISADSRKTRTILSILDVQVDNAQYESGQYDFAVVATTRAEPLVSDRWPPLWGMFYDVFSTRSTEARLLLELCHDKWTIMSYKYQELTEVEIKLGPLALYVEDAFVTAAVDLFRLVIPQTTLSSVEIATAESDILQHPLRLQKLHLHSLDLTLTLHTAVRMYIALDHSPLRLSAFQLQDVMTSVERLTHALTVHYLSAAILGAGWVVGGLELLGAPGALAARVGGASGGVRGVASAAAAALLKSLSACAGSLARNLDLLAGDEEHARRAAAARRRAPTSLLAGLVAGITNFAINILGAVGGLAHHPLVGVAVGETESSTTALRRSLLGAITKPLSATADLVAYAGQGLLMQTGWDPVPQPRPSAPRACDQWSGGWAQDCVRWTFRLADLTALAGFEVLLNDAPLHLLITHKFLVVAEPETSRIVEMIDFKFCSLGPLRGQIIELYVSQRRSSRMSEPRGTIDEDNEYQISAAAMARVARYTGAEGSSNSEARILCLLPQPGKSHALYAFLSAVLHNNTDTHFPLL